MLLAQVNSTPVTSGLSTGICLQLFLETDLLTSMVDLVCAGEVLCEVG